MTAAQGATADGKSGGNKKQDLDLLKKMAKDHLDQAALQRAVQEKVLKAKEEETKRRVDQARRVEYLVRALREAEKPKLDAMISSTMEDDALYVTQFHSNNLERKRAIYEAAMKVKSRIARMVAHADAFEEAVLVKRREAYEKIKVSLLFLLYHHLTLAEKVFKQYLVAPSDVPERQQSNYSTTKAGTQKWKQRARDERSGGCMTQLAATLISSTVIKLIIL